MRVSVIIPAFNRREMLREALASVRAQTLAAHEVIVVDDGSTDGTGEVALDAGPPVLVLAQANKGPAAARNLGISHATCEAIAFLDSDDLMTPRRLELQVAALLADLGHQAAFGLQQQFRDIVDGATGDTTRQFGKPHEGRLPGALLIRRSLVDSLGPMDESLRTGEFAEWFARPAALAATVAVVDEVVLLRRVHAGNLTACAPHKPPDYTSAVAAHLARLRRGA